MIFANLRAGAWKYTALALAVLAVAALIAGLLFRASAAASSTRADAATARAAALQGELRAAQEAAKRDDLSAAATDGARQALDNQLGKYRANSARVSDYASRAATGCTVDADLLRELADGAQRVSAAEDRLRGVRGSASPAAQPAKPD